MADIFLRGCLKSQVALASLLTMMAVWPRTPFLQFC